MDEEDKKVLTSQNATLENMPNRGLISINESGLYSLILSSKLPTAKAIRDYVDDDDKLRERIVMSGKNTIVIPDGISNRGLHRIAQTYFTKIHIFKYLSCLKVVTGY